MQSLEGLRELGVKKYLGFCHYGGLWTYFLRLPKLVWEPYNCVCGPSSCKSHTPSYVDRNIKNEFLEIIWALAAPPFFPRRANCFRSVARAPRPRHPYPAMYVALLAPFAVLLGASKHYGRLRKLFFLWFLSYPRSPSAHVIKWTLVFKCHR